MLISGASAPANKLKQIYLYFTFLIDSQFQQGLLQQLAAILHLTNC